MMRDFSVSRSYLQSNYLTFQGFTNNYTFNFQGWMDPKGTIIKIHQPRVWKFFFHNYQTRKYTHIWFFSYNAKWVCYVFVQTPLFVPNSDSPFSPPLKGTNRESDKPYTCFHECRFWKAISFSSRYMVTPCYSLNYASLTSRLENHSPSCFSEKFQVA